MHVPEARPSAVGSARDAVVCSHDFGLCKVILFLDI
jgi:hypothetical protein